MLCNLFLVMIACNHEFFEHLENVWKSVKTRFFSAKRKNPLCWNTLSKPTVQSLEIILKLLPQTDSTINAFIYLEVWHINSVYAPLSRNDSGFFPDNNFTLLKEKDTNY